MRRGFLRWLSGRGGGGPGPRRRRSRLTGCLMWVLLLVIGLVVASLLFGGFQKGTKAGVSGAPAPAIVTAGW
jgi:hypothetical protein